jgi:hypothetical protein
VLFFLHQARSYAAISCSLCLVWMWEIGLAFILSPQGQDRTGPSVCVCVCGLMGCARLRIMPNKRRMEVRLLKVSSMLDIDVYTSIDAYLTTLISMAAPSSRLPQRTPNLTPPSRQVWGQPVYPIPMPKKSPPNQGQQTRLIGPNVEYHKETTINTAHTWRKDIHGHRCSSSAT